MAEKATESSGERRAAGTTSETHRADGGRIIVFFWKVFLQLFSASGIKLFHRTSRPLSSHIFCFSKHLFIFPGRCSLIVTSEILLDTISFLYTHTHTQQCDTEILTLFNNFT